MSEVLKKSWSSIVNSSAKNYLRGFSLDSAESKIVIADILKGMARKDNKLSIIEFGCGNGQLFETFVDEKIDCHYTGVDFSEPLLSAARDNFTNFSTSFVMDDVEKLTKIIGKYDVGIYSHVIETLSSPEESLFNAKKIVNVIIIRFFEPPNFAFDRVELREMPISEDSDATAPYLRRQMSADYYQRMLFNLECKKVEIYDDLTSKDEVHVLHFKD